MDRFLERHLVRVPHRGILTVSLETELAFAMAAFDSRLQRSAFVSRRVFVRQASSLCAAAFWPQFTQGAITHHPSFSSDPFQLGIASGDPSPDGFVLWTRLAPQPLIPGGGLTPDPIAVHWQVAEDDAMSRVVRQGTVIASADWAHSVHVELTGLRPDRWYWYQFKAGNDLSPVGRTRTFPDATRLPETLRFAFASCQHYETGLYTAYDHMVREDLDLVVHLGDYIYERGIGTTGPRRHNGPEIMSLDDYRARYSLYKMDPALKAIHAAVPWILTPDDHEVDNNYANNISEEKGVSPTQFLRRRAAAYKAYYEHMPFRRSSLPSGPDMRVYRRLGFGQLANFFVLDTRQYRTDQPCGDGNKPPCAEALSRWGTLMGGAQRRWLFHTMDQSAATWNVLAQQVMMARVDRAVGPEIAHSMDQWPGYEYERRRVLRRLRDHRIRNPIVLTGDIHSNWANELLTDFDPSNPTKAAVEFVGTSISSGGDGSAAPKELGQLLAQNPCVKFHNQERGYVRCVVSPQEWRSDYRTVEFVSKPGAPLHTRASFLVRSGHSSLIQT